MIKYSPLKIEEPFVSPQWFRGVSGKKHIVTVQEGGSVVINSVKLSGCPYPAGTQVQVTFFGIPKCVSLTELEEEKRLTEAALKKQSEKEKEDKDRRRDEAARFYNGFRIPFKFSVTMISHLSGLRSPNGLGNGTTRSSVLHMTIEAKDLTVARLRRRKGDTLCKGTGKDYAGSDRHAIHHFDSNGDSYNPIITCTKCLKLIQRFKVSA